MIFEDRNHAGELLADKLARLHPPDPIVLGIPRGGVAVGLPIAKLLRCPLDAILVRKLPIPWSPEAGFGAISGDGEIVLNDPLVARVGLTQKEIEKIAEQVLAEVRRRERVYRGGKPPLDLSGKTVIVTDDGLATGFTALAAVQSVKKRRPAQVILAAPVASIGSVEVVQAAVDHLLTLHVSYAPAFAVASFYHDFSDMSDDEVVRLLSEAAADKASKGEADASAQQGKIS